MQGTRAERTATRRAYLAAALWMAACDGAVAVQDGGVVDAAPLADAGRDAGPRDGGSDGAIADAGADAGTPGCDVTGCDDGQACVRSVCIADCGGDVSGFDAALGAGLVPVAHFCRGPSAYAVRVTDEGAIVYDVTASVEGDVATITLSRWTLEPATPTPSPTEIGGTEHDAEGAGVTAFAGGYVALDPSGEHALFGYTTSAAGSPGQVFRVRIADGMGWKEAAPGNFDAAWIGADAYLVNGAGLGALTGGQGLYASDLMIADRVVQVGAGFGDYSGSVAVGPSFVLAGAADASFESHVYALPRAALETALAGGATIDFGADPAVSEVLDPDGAPISSTFSLLGDRLLTTPYGGPLTSYAAAFTDGELILSDPRVLATGMTFTDAVPAGDGQLLLARYDATTFAVVSLLLVRE